MSVLTRDVILQEIDDGRVVIEPFERDQVGVASIDLTLAREIRIIEPNGGVIEIVDQRTIADNPSHNQES